MILQLATRRHSRKHKHVCRPSSGTNPTISTVLTSWESLPIRAPACFLIIIMPGVRVRQLLHQKRQQKEQKKKQAPHSTTTYLPMP